MLTLPLALLGMVLYWLPYQLPRAVARRLHGDPDVTSTYKLGVACSCTRCGRRSSSRSHS